MLPLLRLVEDDTAALRHMSEEGNIQRSTSKWDGDCRRAHLDTAPERGCASEASRSGAERQGV